METEKKKKQQQRGYLSDCLIGPWSCSDGIKDMVSGLIVSMNIQIFMEKMDIFICVPVCRCQWSN